MGKGNKTTQIRNVLPRRMYKERGQLAHRQHLGILEKRKDYKKRSDNFKHKNKIISKSTISADSYLVYPPILCFFKNNWGSRRSWETLTSSITRCTLRRWSTANTESFLRLTRIRPARCRKIETLLWSIWSDRWRQRKLRKWRKISIWLTSQKWTRRLSLFRVTIR